MWLSVFASNGHTQPPFKIWSQSRRSGLILLLHSMTVSYILLISWLKIVSWHFSWKIRYFALLWILWIFHETLIFNVLVNTYWLRFCVKTISVLSQIKFMGVPKDILSTFFNTLVTQAMSSYEVFHKRNKVKLQATLDNMYAWSSSNPARNGRLHH